MPKPLKHVSADRLRVAPVQISLPKNGIGLFNIDKKISINQSLFCLPHWQNQVAKKVGGYMLTQIADTETDQFDIATDDMTKLAEEIFDPITSSRTPRRQSEKELPNLIDPHALPLADFCKIHKSKNIGHASMAFSERYGFLMSHSRFSHEQTPDPKTAFFEPISMWCFESYMLDKMRMANRLLTIAKRHYTETFEINSYVNEGLRSKFSDGHLLPNISLPAPILQFAQKLTFDEDFYIDWEFAIKYSANYYLDHLCRPQISLKRGNNILIAPKNLLGGLWLKYFLQNMYPELDPRYCSQCGYTIINDLPPQQKYCEACNTPAAKQRRVRTRKKERVI